jgi:transcriptional regulator
MTDEELIYFMQCFTLYFENDGTNSATVFDNLPDAYLQKMLPAIVGFEIKADGIENVFKLSQNRDKESYVNIINKLKASGGQDAMVA